MAIKDTTDNEKLFLTLDNGDLEKITEVMEKWSFKDYESLLRFCMSLLLVTEDKFLSIKKNGIPTAVVPISDLIKDESVATTTLKLVDPGLVDAIAVRLAPAGRGMLTRNQMIKSNPSDGFNPEAQLKEVSDIINQPERFAATFCNAASSQKSIDETLKKIVKEVILHDKDAQKELRKIYAECAKEDWKFLGKKLAFAVWSIVLLEVAALLNHWLGK